MADSISSRLFGAVKDKLYDLDFLRDVAYSDKQESKTRLSFTLFLIIVVAGGFAGFFIFYAVTRPLVQQTLSGTGHGGQVQYKDFLKANGADKVNDTSFQCVTRAEVKYEDIAQFIYSGLQNEANQQGESAIDIAFDSVYIYGCESWYNSTLGDRFQSYFYEYVCEDAVETFYKSISENHIPQGTFYGPEDLATLYDELSDNAVMDTYDSDFSSYFDAAFVTHNWQTLNNYTALLLNDSFYNSIDDGVYQVSVNITFNYTLYFELANVSTCTYFAKSSWFVVFTNSLNGTSSFFGVFLFAIGVAYSIIKKIQHTERVKSIVSKNKLSRDSITTSDKEIPLEVRLEKKEEKETETETV